VSYIVLAIVFSLAIGVIFKLFERYEVNAYQAIVTNYLVCVITGCLTLGEIPFKVSFLWADWMPLILVLGLLFISGFNFVSLTVRYFGIAISSVAQRMSIGLSVPFAIWYYGENYTLYKVGGVLLALLSVLLINIPAKTNPETTTETTGAATDWATRWRFIFPLGAFLISVFIEIILQYLHEVHKMAPAVESIVLFFVAGTLGLVGLLFFREPFRWRNVIGGIILGIPNYFSIYFLLKGVAILGGAVSYSINNIAVVTLSALIGYLVFKERLSLYNWMGIAVALMAIFLITYETTLALLQSFVS